MLRPSTLTHKVDLRLVPLGAPLYGCDVVVEGACGPAEQKGPDLHAVTAMSATQLQPIWRQQDFAPG